MKKYLIIAGLLCFMIGMLVWQNHEIDKWKEKYQREHCNVEAYQARNSSYENDIREYQLSMDELRDSRDSIDRKLAEMVDELKLKDKRIQYLQYQVKVAERTDTVVMNDTIFSSPTFYADTIIGDEWYNLVLKMYYPNIVVATPRFRSEQYVLINKKREYKRKPSRIFFVRWFQKKYDVVEVVVKEENIYVTNNEQRFVKIVK